MELDFYKQHNFYPSYKRMYKKITSITLKHLGFSFAPIISISFVDNTTIHEINKDYRKIDRPTDVISFAFLDGEKNIDKILHSNNEVSLGDIYISYPKAEEQAQEYQHSIERELCFLYIHGLLHLLGYDHIKKEDEEIMFPLQEEILRKVGI